ncbi:MAG: OmpA family protein [Bacteroidales bacterium]
MPVKVVLTIFLSYCCLGTSIAQEGISKKAVSLYEKAKTISLTLEPDKKIATLKEAIERSPNYFQALVLLAQCYDDLDETESQLEYSLKAYAVDSTRLYILPYKIATCFRRLRDFGNTEVWLEKYIADSKPSKTRTVAKQMLEDLPNVVELYEGNKDIELERLSSNVNTANSEYWPSLSVFENELIFTRLLPTSQMPQEDFYVSHLVGGEWHEAVPLPGAINTPYNEGAQCISSDGKIILYTNCSADSRRRSCEIYMSVKTDEGWSQPFNVGVPVNSSAWDGQPSFSANQKELYFVSNRPGGCGGKDIWKCELKGFVDGRPVWGDAVNLGVSVNTNADDISPFIHSDNQTLYFASKGWISLGDFDIFKTSYNAETKEWSKVQNLGCPINTEQAEQGLFVSRNGRTAFMSSGRDEANKMDIFTFELPEKYSAIPTTYISGTITDLNTGEPICAKMEFFNISNNQLFLKSHSCMGEKGSFLFCLPMLGKFAFNVSRDGYLIYSSTFQLDSVNDVDRPYNIDVRLTPIDTNKNVVLNNIAFAINSSELLPESTYEIDKLIEFLNNNPSIEIELSGHTDNTGNSEHNLKLSISRAKSVYEALRANNISPNRLSYKGFGDTRPIADNNTEEGRKINRRTEFKIVGMQ